MSEGFRGRKLPSSREVLSVFFFKHFVLNLKVGASAVALFITKKSLFIFHQFKLSHGFLEKEPENWKDDESFQASLVLLKDIKVVNDIAERAVALMEEYNELLTRDEEQKQYLLHVVKYHRTQYPNCNVNANKS